MTINKKNGPDAVQRDEAEKFETNYQEGAGTMDNSISAAPVVTRTADEVTISDGSATVTVPVRRASSLAATLLEAIGLANVMIGTLPRIASVLGVDWAALLPRDKPTNECVERSVEAATPSLDERSLTLRLSRQYKLPAILVGELFYLAQRRDPDNCAIVCHNRYSATGTRLGPDVLVTPTARDRVVAWIRHIDRTSTRHDHIADVGKMIRRPIDYCAEPQNDGVGGGL